MSVNKKQTVKQYKIIKRFIYKGFEVHICKSSNFGKFKYVYNITTVNDHAKRIVKNHVDKYWCHNKVIINSGYRLLLPRVDEAIFSNHFLDKTCNMKIKTCIESARSIINIYLNVMSRTIYQHKI